MWLQQGLDAAWGLPKAAQGTGMTPEEAFALRFPKAELLAKYATDVADTIVPRIEQMSDQGASTKGTIHSGDALVAEIELMFSHVDQNMAGQKFPEHNFVFTEQFQQLLKSYRIDPAIGL